MTAKSPLIIALVALALIVPAAFVASGRVADDAAHVTHLLADDDHDHEEREPAAEMPVDYSQAFFHTQSEGNRGEDVRAIQYLLKARGYSISTDGVFGSGTKSTVQSFQSSQGLGSDGIVGTNTWNALVITVRQGDNGDAVKAVQNLLNHKRSAGLVVDGIFGSGTKSAVQSFQSHAGISSDGIVGPTTWKNLIWHYEKPNTGLSSVCGYYPESKRWGTAAAVGQLEATAGLFYGRGWGPVAVGDLSLEHGGDISGHASHEVGLDADIRPVRNDGLQCSYGTSVGWSSYNSARTKQLCWDFRAKATNHIKLILFNDQSVINAGCSQWYSNHDNHLHVRWCEKIHSNSYYDC